MVAKHRLLTPNSHALQRNAQLGVVDDSSRRVNKAMRIECNWERIIGATIIAIAVLVFLGGSIWALRPVAPVVTYFIYPRPNMARLQAEGDRLFEAIQRYHGAHGSYPASLQEARIKAPLTWWGRWRYSRLPDGTFQIEVGNYDWHGFTLSRGSGSDWNHDT